VPAEADGPFVSATGEAKMKLEACAAHDESAKTESVGHNLEVPISLTPEQLASVAAGLSLSPNMGRIYGFILKSAFNPGNFTASLNPSSLPGARATFEL
jgi:hypothetical protein